MGMREDTRAAFSNMFFFGAYRFRRGESFPEKLPGAPQIRNIKQMGEIGQSMNWMRTVTLLSVPQRVRASIS